MWNGKKKAITFSYDDGILQDIKTIELLDKYNLKATFNVNSGFLGTFNQLFRNEHSVQHNKIKACELREIYKNHEVAVHGFTHPELRQLDEKTIIDEIEIDRKVLSAITGKEVVGMAFPFGFYDDRVVEIIKNNTPIKYARTVTSTYNFDLQTDLLRFNPTIQETEENLFEVVKRFLEMKTEKYQLLYIWGHTFEMDAEYITWEKLEELFKMLANKDDIFYGTNEEVLLAK